MSPQDGERDDEPSVAETRSTPTEALIVRTDEDEDTMEETVKEDKQSNAHTNDLDATTRTVQEHQQQQQHPQQHKHEQLEQATPLDGQDSQDDSLPTLTADLPMSPRTKDIYDDHTNDDNGNANGDVANDNINSDEAASPSHSQEIMTQDMTQLAFDEDEASASMDAWELSQQLCSQSDSQLPSAFCPPPPPQPWGKLLPNSQSAAATTTTTTTSIVASIELMPKASNVAVAMSSPSYISPIFNEYTLGRSAKADVTIISQQQQQHKSYHIYTSKSGQPKRLDLTKVHAWAHSMISNRHCRIYCQTKPSHRNKASPGNISINGNTSTTATDFDIYIEDMSGNGTLINQTTVLRYGERRLLHSGDEICLVLPEVLRKRIQRKRILQSIVQSYSYIFVRPGNLENLLQPRNKSILKVKPSLQLNTSTSSNSSEKKKHKVVNPRAMNYHTRHNSSDELRSSIDNVDKISADINLHSNADDETAHGKAAPSQPPYRRIEMDYDIREVLGDGTSGQVRRAIHRRTGQQVAVKMIALVQKGGRVKVDIRMVQHEVDILRKLDHPHIVRLRDVYIRPNVCLYLVLDLLQGGDLFDSIVARTQYSEMEARRTMRRLCSALYYLHEEQHIVHRDLKPENIVLKSKAVPWSVQLTDFGLAKICVGSDMALKTFCGTPQYFAPEVLQRQHTKQGEGRYGKPADLWSLGVILYILLVGQPPFDSPDEHRDESPTNAVAGSAAKPVVTTFTTATNTRTLWWPEEYENSLAADLVQQLCKQDPKRRMTIRAACNHPWLQVDDGDTHVHPLDDPEIHLASTCKELFPDSGQGDDGKNANEIDKKGEHKGESNTSTSTNAAKEKSEEPKSPALLETVSNSPSSKKQILSSEKCRAESPQATHKPADILSPEQFSYSALQDPSPTYTVANSDKRSTGNSKRGILEFRSSPAMPLSSRDKTSPISNLAPRNARGKTQKSDKDQAKDTTAETSNDQNGLTANDCNSAKRMKLAPLNAAKESCVVKVGSTDSPSVKSKEEKDVEVTQSVEHVGSPLSSMEFDYNSSDQSDKLMSPNLLEDSPIVAAKRETSGRMKRQRDSPDLTKDKDKGDHSNDENKHETLAHIDPSFQSKRMKIAVAASVKGKQPKSVDKPNASQQSEEKTVEEGLELSDDEIQSQFSDGSKTIDSFNSHRPEPRENMVAENGKGKHKQQQQQGTTSGRKRASGNKSVSAKNETKNRRPSPNSGEKDGQTGRQTTLSGWFVTKKK